MRTLSHGCEGMLLEPRQGDWLLGGWMSASWCFLRPIQGAVRNDSSELFKKLGVSDRTQAVVTALRYGLVSLNDL